jgi:hypothetical protein
MANGKGKLSYAVGLAVAEIVRTSKRPTFDTFTFAENVTDKKEASKRWRVLKERLKRYYPGLRSVGVWQRQKRGAWHFHALFDRMLDVNLVRPWAIAVGFGPQLNMRPVSTQAGFRNQWSASRVARYITRYITRDVEGLDKGVRLVEYCGDARKATVAFRWANGIAYLWRTGRAEWNRIYGIDETPKFDEFWVVVRLGWEVLEETEREFLKLTNDRIAQWWDPENYPF